MAHRKLSHRLAVGAAPFLVAGVAVASSAPTPAQDEQRRSRTALHRRILESSTIDAHRHGHISIFARPSLCEGGKDAESEPDRFKRVLGYHRSRIAIYRQQWEYKADSAATTSTTTPSRSWPDDVPSNDQLSYLLDDVIYCSRSPNFRSDKEYCNRLRFRVASALIIQFDEESQRKGLKMLKDLAENGDADAMVYYGMCLNEGRAGMDPDSNAAVRWLKRCVDIYEHPQSLYELGVAFYTGEGVVEDEEEAVRLFQLAAGKDHAAASYMLGDCLLDGIGVDMDRGMALEWLVRSAELGHRGARSRVMAVLEKKEGADYGGFTDASRQTMLGHIAQTGQVVRRRTTLRNETGGGLRNPSELARRQTIVGKSRNTS
ncbi:hypothetical protein ACHAXT_003091 [Thalassiosira profunda]